MKNQILNTKLKRDKDIKKKNWFHFQFSISIVVTILLLVAIIFYFYKLQKQENISENLASNYTIFQLYGSTQKNKSEKDNSNSLFRHNRNT